MVSFAVPPGACDCHTHRLRRSGAVPVRAHADVLPGPALVEEMRVLHRALQTERVVIVQPSVYGTDNACTLDALRQLGARARGVAVIDDGTSDDELDRMDRAGIRGIRVNLETAGQTDPAVRQRFEAATRRVARRRWHIQVFTRPTVIAAIADAVAAAPVPVVFDHFGGAQGAPGVTQPGFDALLTLVRTGKAYVKISALSRLNAARLRGHGLAGQGPDCRQPAADPLGQRDWRINTFPTAPPTEAGTAPRVRWTTSTCSICSPVGPPIPPFGGPSWSIIHIHVDNPTAHPSRFMRSSQTRSRRPDQDLMTELIGGMSTASSGSDSRRGF